MLCSDVENNKVAGWVNGKPAVIVDVQRQPGANIVATADAVKKTLPEIENSIPTGIKILSARRPHPNLSALRYQMCNSH